MLLGSLAGWHRLVGILVLQVAEREPAGFCDLYGAGDRIREGSEQARHFRGRLQMPLGVDCQPETRLGNGALLADAGDDVGEGAPLRRVVEHVIGGDQRCAGLFAELIEQPEPAGLVAMMTVHAGKKTAPPRCASERC
jgi:hypothetical protein